MKTRLKRCSSSICFSRKLTNLEVVEFGEARAERHSPKKVSGASPCSEHIHA